MGRTTRSASRAPDSSTGTTRTGRRTPPTVRDLPTGPVPTTTGTVRLVPDPDSDTGVTLHVNDVPSSHLDLADPGFLGFEYMQQMAAVIDGLSAGPLQVVHLGAAGCALARYVEHARPGSRQLGIDLDARLLELVREWFALPRSPRLRLRAGDARAQLASLPPASADVVVRDVFAGDTTPAHLLTQEFVQEVARVLRPGGVYLANCADRPPLTSLRRELVTVARALGDDDTGLPAWQSIGLVAEPAVLKGRRYGNAVVVAVADPGDGPRDRTGPGGDAALTRPVPDALDTSLGRRLRALAVPTRLLTGAELSTFAGTAQPFVDPAVS